MPSRCYKPAGRVWTCQPRAARASTLSHAPQPFPSPSNPKLSALHVSCCRDALSNVEDSLLYSAVSLNTANLGRICSRSRLSCFPRRQALYPHLSPKQSCPDNSAFCSWQAQLLQGITLIHSSLHRAATHMYNWTTGCGNNKRIYYHIWFLGLKGFPSFPCLLTPSSYLDTRVKWVTKPICYCGE